MARQFCNMLSLCTVTGSGTSTRPHQDVSHTTTTVRGGINDSHTSMDSLQASDALIMAAFTDNNTPGASQSFASDTDLLGVGSKRPISPGSQAGSEADSVASSRLSSRPVAGWKGRMSSMLIRSSPGPGKPEKEAVKDTLKMRMVPPFFVRSSHQPLAIKYKSDTTAAILHASIGVLSIVQGCQANGKRLLLTGQPIALPLTADASASLRLTTP